jgi:hypothetical protein
MAYTYESAQTVVNNNTTESAVDADAKARALAANVPNAALIGYAAAMLNYENRTDIESLSDRRLRENAPEFSDQDKFRDRRYLAGDGYDSSPGT